MMEGCVFLFEEIAWSKAFFVVFGTHMHIKLLTLHSISFISIPAIFYFCFFFFFYLNHTIYKSPLADIFW